MAVSMLVQTLYLLADLFWVGRLGKEAIAAVGVAGNLMMVVLALTQMLFRRRNDDTYFTRRRKKRSTGSRTRLQPILDYVDPGGGSLGFLRVPATGCVLQFNQRGRRDRRVGEKLSFSGSFPRCCSSFRWSRSVRRFEQTALLNPPSGCRCSAL